jgi:hypothetical protein
LKVASCSSSQHGVRAHDLRACHAVRWLLRAATLALLLSRVQSVAAESLGTSTGSGQLFALTQPALLAHVAPTAAFGLRDVLPKNAEQKRIAGWILVGAGALHLVLLPVCLSEVHGRGERTACVATMGGLGIAAITIGVIFLVQGYQSAPRRRARKHAWLDLRNLGLAAQPHAGMVVYRAVW